MTHIKYLTAILIIGIFAFYQGINVGLDKMGMHRVAVESLSRERSQKIIKEISIEQFLQRELEFAKAKQFDAIKTYGAYLASFSYHVPDLSGLDSNTKSFIHNIAKKVLEEDPDYFRKMEKYYDSVIEEFKESDNLLAEEYLLYKEQLKLVENQLEE